MIFGTYPGLFQDFSATSLRLLRDFSGTSPRLLRDFSATSLGLLRDFSGTSGHLWASVWIVFLFLVVFWTPFAVDVFASMICYHPIVDVDAMLSSFGLGDGLLCWVLLLFIAIIAMSADVDDDALIAVVLYEQFHGTIAIIPLPMIVNHASGLVSGISLQLCVPSCSLPPTVMLHLWNS